MLEASERYAFRFYLIRARRREAEGPLPHTTLKRERLIGVCHDRMLRPGEHLDRAIEVELAAADLVILLVSPDFINSDYCTEREMQRAFARAKEGRCKVVPVILKQGLRERWKRMREGHVKSVPLAPARRGTYLKGIINDFRQAALDGRLPIWAKRSGSEVWEVVPREFWKD